MLKIDHNSDGKVSVTVERGERKTLMFPGQITISLYPDWGIVQMGCNRQCLPEQRIVEVGDKTSGIVGDYLVTIERIAKTNKIIKLRPDR